GHSFSDGRSRTLPMPTASSRGTVLSRLSYDLVSVVTFVSFVTSFTFRSRSEVENPYGPGALLYRIRPSVPIRYIRSGQPVYARSTLLSIPSTSAGILIANFTTQVEAKSIRSADDCGDANSTPSFTLDDSCQRSTGCASWM